LLSQPWMKDDKSN